MDNLFASINLLIIPDFWQIVFSLILSLSLVYLVEWFKNPDVSIEVIDPLILQDGRKFLKVRVSVFTRLFIKRIFPWRNTAAFAKLKGVLIVNNNNMETEITEFTAKWDRNPEPWDYDKNKLRPELLPSTSAPQNFISGDSDTASVLVKHKGEDEFYIYDTNYYVNPFNNQVNEKNIILRLFFISSVTNFKKDFNVVNSDRAGKYFALKEILKSNSYNSK